MIRIAIVEDNDEDAARIMDCLNRYSTETGRKYEVIHYKDPRSFIEEHKKSRHHLVFMDVDMPEMSGIDAAKKMRETDAKTVLVFVTNLAQYAIEGYEVNAIDFVLKPVNYFSFKLKIRRALMAVLSQSEKRMSIQTTGGCIYIRVSQISYIEVQAHNLIYHMGTEEVATTGTLKDAEESLKGEPFFRCNYCYLVSFPHVTKVDGNSVYVDGQELQISRNRKKEFLQQLSLFYSSGGQ